MKSSLLLLTHNRYQMTKYCVEALLNRAGTDDFELLILDNGSTDPRTLKLSQEESFPTVKGGTVILEPKNIGIAAGYNNLLQKASGEYIVFLTNDILLDENWLVDLIHWNEQVDKAGATSIHSECVKGQYSPVLNKNDNFINVWVPPTGVVFGPILINRAAFDAVGLFDERLGMYGKEREQYCTRLKEMGYNNFYIPEQYSVHLGREVNEVSEYRKMKEVEMQKAMVNYNAYLNEMRKTKNFKL